MTDSSRRTFLGAAAAVSTLPVTKSPLFKKRPDELRVGLIGCGGRGTGAASQALRADSEARLVAMGDAFGDRLDRSFNGLQSTDVAEQLDVPESRRFTGFNAFQQVIDQDLDVVILASPPHFRPHHLKAAIDKGLHVFAEKPVAVDAPGLHSVLDSCRRAKEKNLNVVSGLCYRYHEGRQAIMKEIHEGRIGEIRSLNANYITGGLWSHARTPEWSDMEWQVRNWIYFTWLSGDHIAEQHIHSLDVMAWAMQDKYPVSALSMGGRQSRVQPEYGHVFDHFSTIFEWENGVKGHSYCRQQVGCDRDVNDYIYGQTGDANVFRHRITGENPWQYDGDEGAMFGAMYQNEHDELFKAIRGKGDTINNGEYMCNSTMMAVMGRMSAYTGKKITWDQAWESEEILGPDSYEFGSIDVPEIARPGITPFR
ncbi:MAG: Gfo/Idh/MocA family oxidoreductase [Planctomycetota bacterium]